MRAVNVPRCIARVTPQRMHGGRTVAVHLGHVVRPDRIGVILHRHGGQRTNAAGTTRWG